MIQTYLTGILLIMAISGLWLGVQRLWQRRFPECENADALAGRSGCRNCNCGATERRQPTTIQPDREAR